MLSITHGTLFRDAMAALVVFASLFILLGRQFFFGRFANLRLLNTLTVSTTVIFTLNTLRVMPDAFFPLVVLALILMLVDVVFSFKLYKQHRK